jgi:NADH-quinone oxidoreductase subunit N
MNAPVLWIILPLIMAGLLILINNQKAVTLIACLFTLFLALAAWLIPIENSLTIGGFSFQLGSSLQILGRRLSLTSADRSLLMLIYGSTFFWFLPATMVRVARRLVPFGLAIIALLVAALAVEPQLYAALLIETAVLLSIPLLSTDQQKKGKGLLRFLIFQTLAVPFILFSGWILAGIEANPGNIALARQAAIFLGLGFAFLLAIFPFYTWIPLLSEEVHPYILGFILWALPTVTMFFGLGFLDHYAWLRESPATETILSTAGLLMVVSGGLLSAFQRHLGRIMGYAVIFETGYSLLALSLMNRPGINLFLLLLVPRSLCLGIWAFSLSILKDHTPSLILNDVKGFARLWPFTSAGLVLSNLALAGVPLLAGFPVHLAIWEELSRSSINLALWVFLGSLGLCASAIRVLITLVSAPEGTSWGAREKGLDRLLLGVGWLALFLLGLFPQWVLPLWSKLPPLFEHLGQ